MAKHWAETYYTDFELIPQAGDEALFLSILLIGEDEVIRRNWKGHRNRAAAIESFCAEHHIAGAAAKAGVWARFEIWKDKHAKELTTQNN